MISAYWTVLLGPRIGLPVVVEDPGILDFEETMWSVLHKVQSSLTPLLRLIVFSLL